MKHISFAFTGLALVLVLFAPTITTPQNQLPWPTGYPTWTPLPSPTPCIWQDTHPDRCGILPYPIPCNIPLVCVPFEDRIYVYLPIVKNMSGPMYIYLPLINSTEVPK